MRLRLISIAVLTLVVAETGFAGGPLPPSRYSTGTFTNLKYNDEAGDLIGIEIKIVPVVSERFQAAIQESEGEPGPLTIVDVEVKGGNVAFRVNTDGNAGWSFSGTVSAKALSGVITHASGRKENISLQRRCSYWDR